MLDNIEPSLESLEGRIIEIGVPLFNRQIAREDDCCKVARYCPSFNFQHKRISVRPLEDVGYVDNSSKFIDNNIILSLVSVPPFCSWIFTESTCSEFVPSKIGLARSSNAPVKFHVLWSKRWTSMVFSNSAQGTVILNVNTRRDNGIVQKSRDCGDSNCIPVKLGISSDW